MLSLTSKLVRDCPSVWNIFFLSHSIIRDIKCQNILASGNLCWHPKACLGKSFCVSSVFYLSLFHSLYHCIELIATYLSDSHSRSMCLTTKNICLMNAEVKQTETLFCWCLNQFNKLESNTCYFPCPVLEVGDIMMNALLQTRNVQFSITESVTNW